MPPMAPMASNRSAFGRATARPQPGHRPWTCLSCRSMHLVRLLACWPSALPLAKTSLVPGKEELDFFRQGRGGPHPRCRDLVWARRSTARPGGRLSEGGSLGRAWEAARWKTLLCLQGFWPPKGAKGLAGQASAVHAQRQEGKESQDQKVWERARSARRGIIRHKEAHARTHSHVQLTPPPPNHPRHVDEQRPQQPCPSRKKKAVAPFGHAAVAAAAVPAAENANAAT